MRNGNWVGSWARSGYTLNYINVCMFFMGLAEVCVTRPQQGTSHLISGQQKAPLVRFEPRACCFGVIVYCRCLMGLVTYQDFSSGFHDPTPISEAATLSEQVSKSSLMGTRTRFGRPPALLPSRPNRIQTRSVSFSISLSPVVSQIL